MRMYKTRFDLFISLFILIITLFLIFPPNKLQYRVSAVYVHYNKCLNQGGGGICCGGHLAVMYGGELMYLRIFS